MAEDKNSFIAYCDWMETFEELPDDKAGQLAKHLFRYVNDLNPKSDDILINAVFANIKNALKRDLIKYKEIKVKRSESGKKGGRPKKQVKAKKANALSEKQTKAKKAVSDSVNVSVSDNEEKKIPVFEDFKKYAIEKDSSLDLKALKNKYDSWVVNNWKDGNNKKIVNWKSKILNTIAYLPKNTINNTERSKNAFG